MEMFDSARADLRHMRVSPDNDRPSMSYHRILPIAVQV